MIKKIAVLYSLIILFVLVPSFGVKAAEPISNEKNLEKTLISSVSYYDEATDSMVCEKTYLIGNDNQGDITRDASGYGTYINEKTHTWDGGETMTYYAQGYFVWGNGSVSVSNPTGGVYGYPSSVTISNRSLTSGTGQYLYVFNQFAYVTYSFDTTNMVGMQRSWSVTIRISQSGNNI